ncbi:MAG: UbiA family prenyltransferase [Sphingobacteriales bacterium]|nr:UbiA family prenyltransferase [Sphingobacteriales bacterium]
MTKYLRQSLDFLIFSNIFISLGAAAQGLVTYHLLDLKPSGLVLGFLFFSTLLTYNFSILIQKPSEKQKKAYKRVNWIFSHYRLNVSITLIAILALIALFFLLSFGAQILIVFLGILSIGYALPLFSVGKRRFGLRNIPGLKLFLIALVWALSSVVLPVIEYQKNHVSIVSHQDLIILLAKRFLFIVAITIPFDIRDMFQDKSYNLKTIPTVFGEKNAYLFCQMMLVSSLGLLFLFRGNGFNADFFALAITIILTGWLIFKSKWEKNEYYYFFFLDGTLILQFVMLFLFNFIW